MITKPFVRLIWIQHLKKKKRYNIYIYILLEPSDLVSSKQYRPRTTDNDFTIQIFRHFLPDRKQSNFAQKFFNKSDITVKLA